MKFKHNKKRNTAFLYEALIKEFTISIVNQNVSRQNIIKNILKEFFAKGTILKSELNIYNTLLEYRSDNRSECYRLMHEIKRDFFSLNRKEVFNAQTKLIKKINESISNSLFSSFLSNYRNIATVGQFLNSEGLPARQRMLLEDKTYNMLSSKSTEANSVKHVDNLTFNTFVNKFNETYKNSLQLEQRTLLSHYITSFANNGLELKTFVNEEIVRLKEVIRSNMKDSVYESQFKAVLHKLNHFSASPINESMVKEIFYLQELAHEVSKNDS